VLCIRGKWGVGKTFMWSAVLKAAQAEKKIGLRSQSYVSLFGINSLEQLKYSIFENSTLVEHIGVEPGLESFKTPDVATFTRNLNAAVDHAKKMIAPAMQAFAPKGLQDAASQAFTFLAVRNMIICIDDLERRGANLSMRDVLGLVAYLKEQRGCKVVLIVNDGELGNAADDFDRFKEKVIDKSIEFAPDASDCVRVGILGETPVQELVKEAVLALGLTNIRLIQKIEREALEIYRQPEHTTGNRKKKPRGNSTA
jgi:hypothetical protein